MERKRFWVILALLLLFSFGCSASIQELAKARDVNGLVQKLKDKDWYVRKEAAEALGKIGDKRAVEPLIAALRDKELDVREDAVKALGEIGDKRAVEPLIAILEDPYWRIRSDAVKALGEIGDKRAVEPLIAALRDKDSTVRRMAAEALGKIGDERAVEPLVAAIRDKELDVRRMAPIARIGWKPVNQIVHIVNLIALKEWDEVVKIGAPAVGPLIATLRDKDSTVRRMAAKALGEIGDERAAEPLVAALRDKDSTVRWEAAIALGKIGDPAIKSLVAALRDKDPTVRRMAAIALGKIGDKRAVEPLIAALRDTSSDVREDAAKALGKIGWKPVNQIAALRDGDLFVRMEAAKVLGEIGDKRAVEPLIAALRDTSSDVRRKAAEALGRIGWKPVNQTERSIYLIALQEWDEIVKVGAPAVEPLITVIRDKDSEAYFHPRLRDKETGVRRKAAEALGKIGDKRAVEPLIAALTDKDVNDRVASALIRLGWKPKTQSEKVHLWVAREKIYLLRKNWEMTKNVLLKDMDSGKFYYSFRAFMDIDKKEIIPVLIGRLNSNGGVEMAEAFLNSGHYKLREAAQHWAERNGYIIISVPK